MSDQCVFAETLKDALAMVRKAKVVYGGVSLSSGYDPTYIRLQKGDALRMLKTEVCDGDVPDVRCVGDDVYIN